MNDPIFRVIAAVLLVGFVAHRGFYTRKIQHPADSVIEKPNPGRATQFANLLAMPALLSSVIYIFVPSWISWAALPLPSGLRWLGVGIVLGGFGLLQWAQQALGKNWSDAPKLLTGQRLVSSGPYYWIRHPIYSAFLLILGSLLLISANWCVGALWIGMSSLDITSRIGVEEEMMTRRFGEPYQAYMQRTGRLFPRFILRKGRDA